MNRLEYKVGTMATEDYNHLAEEHGCYPLEDVGWGLDWCEGCDQEVCTHNYLHLQVGSKDVGLYQFGVKDWDLTSMTRLSATLLKPMEIDDHKELKIESPAGQDIPGYKTVDKVVAKHPDGTIVSRVRPEYEKV
jgi:hypothetical protein